MVTTYWSWGNGNWGCNIYVWQEKIKLSNDLPTKDIKFKPVDEDSEFAENVFNTVREPLIVLDQDLRVVKANRSFYDFFKVKPNETIGTLIYDLENRQWNIPKLRELLDNILPQETTFEDYEVEHDFSTIGKRIMLLNARKIHRALGKEKIILLAFEDITGRWNAEKEIIKTNKQLIKLNAEKDKFFSIIAHDLKSPFTGLLNLTELMADSTAEFSQAEFIEISKSLNETAHHLYKLLGNLLEWALMQKGSISFNPKEFNFYNCISQNIGIISQIALQKGITIINEIPKTEIIYADEKMVDTILRNLLSNAVKFTKHDGKIIIASKMTEGKMLEISVKDTGVGISAIDINRLFKIEEKVSSKGTEDELSTGLGLLLCKEFVEKNGGKIRVESEENKGSVFYFTVPTFALSSV